MAPRRPFSPAEDAAIVSGMGKFGLSWSAIQKSSPALSSRTSTQVKDRVRTLEKRTAQRKEEEEESAARHPPPPVAPPPPPSPAPVRQPAQSASGTAPAGKKRLFTPNEDSSLTTGVSIHGLSAWATIVKSYPALSQRTGVQVKDRWRTLENRKRRREEAERLAKQREEEEVRSEGLTAKCPQWP